MLTLYYKPTCAFSQSVLGAADILGLKIDLKDISSDEVLAAELIERGGKNQVPFLIDAAQGVSLYDSNDIIAHLELHYSNMQERSYNGVRVFQSDATCDGCE